MDRKKRKGSLLMQALLVMSILALALPAAALESSVGATLNAQVDVEADADAVGVSAESDTQVRGDADVSGEEDEPQEDQDDQDQEDRDDQEDQDEDDDRYEDEDRVEASAESEARALAKARQITAENIRRQRQQQAEVQAKMTVYVREHHDDFEDMGSCIDALEEQFPEGQLRVMNRLCAPLFLETVQEHLKEKGLTEEEIEAFMTVDEQERKKLIMQNQERLKKLAKLGRDKLETLGQLSRAKIEYLSSLDEDDLEEQDIKEMARGEKRFINDHLVNRKVAVEVKQASVRAETEASQGIAAFKRALSDEEEFLKGSKRKLQDCRDEASEECDAYRAQVLERSQKYLLHFIEIVIKHAEQAEARVQKSDHIDADLAVELEAEMEAIIADMEEAKVLVEEATGKDDLAEAAKRIKDRWQEAKRLLQHTHERLRVSQYGYIIAKAAQLEERLETIKARVEESGLEVEGMDELMLEFSTSVDLAKEEYRLAMDALARYRVAIDNEVDEDTDAILTEVKLHISNAEAALEEAQTTLRAIVALIADAGGAIRDPSRPDYAPGEDLGFFIWQDDLVWHICASGDGEWHRFKAEVQADDGFCRVKPYQYEHNDHMSRSRASLSVWGTVGPHQDCLAFTTNSEEVTFEMAMEPYELVTDEEIEGRYMGKVTLEGEPSECAAPEIGPLPCTREYRPVCGIDGETYSNRCVLDSADVPFAYIGVCRTDAELEAELGIEVEATA